MKKFFVLMLAAAMAFTACEKKPQPIPGPGPGPDDGPAEEYVAPITIDGNYADWAKLPAADVATATCPANAKYKHLQTVKVYADSQFVYFYCEFTPNLEGYVTMDVFLNADNSDETGGYGDHWTDPNSEWLYEGAIESWDAGLYKWWGEVGVNGWLWTKHDAGLQVEEHSSEDAWGAIIGEGNGLTSNSEGGIASGKAEFAIMRAAVEETVKFADTFTIGFMLSADWAEAGFLPSADMTDDNPNGIAPKLVVKVVK